MDQNFETERIFEMEQAYGPQLAFHALEKWNVPQFTNFMQAKRRFDSGKLVFIAASKKIDQKN